MSVGQRGMGGKVSAGKEEKTGSAAGKKAAAAATVVVGEGAQRVSVGPPQGQAAAAGGGAAGAVVSLHEGVQCVAQRRVVVASVLTLALPARERAALREEVSRLHALSTDCLLPLLQVLDTPQGVLYAVYARPDGGSLRALRKDVGAVEEEIVRRLLARLARTSVWLQQHAGVAAAPLLRPETVMFTQRPGSVDWTSSACFHALPILHMAEIDATAADGATSAGERLVQLACWMLQTRPSASLEDCLPGSVHAIDTLPWACRLSTPCRQFLVDMVHALCEEGASLSAGSIVEHPWLAEKALSAAAATGAATGREAGNKRLQALRAQTRESKDLTKRVLYRALLDVKQPKRSAVGTRRWHQMYIELRGGHLLLLFEPTHPRSKGASAKGELRAAGHARNDANDEASFDVTGGAGADGNAAGGGTGPGSLARSRSSAPGVLTMPTAPQAPPTAILLHQATLVVVRSRHPHSFALEDYRTGQALLYLRAESENAKNRALKALSRALGESSAVVFSHAIADTKDIEDEDDDGEAYLADEMNNAFAARNESKPYDEKETAHRHSNGHENKTEDSDESGSEQRMLPTTNMEANGNDATRRPLSSQTPSAGPAVAATWSGADGRGGAGAHSATGSDMASMYSTFWCMPSGRAYRTAALHWEERATELNEVLATGCPIGSPIVQGERNYIVDARWYERWTRFLTSSRRQSAPGPCDNSWMVNAATGHVLSDLREDSISKPPPVLKKGMHASAAGDPFAPKNPAPGDYVRVAPAIWAIIQRIYGAQPGIWFVGDLTAHTERLCDLWTVDPDWLRWAHQDEDELSRVGATPQAATQAAKSYASAFTG